jgi:hypothetical protein
MDWNSARVKAEAQSGQPLEWKYSGARFAAGSSKDLPGTEDPEFVTLARELQSTRPQLCIELRTVDLEPIAAMEARVFSKLDTSAQLVH